MATPAKPSHGFLGIDVNGVTQAQFENLQDAIMSRLATMPGVSATVRGTWDQEYAQSQQV